MMTSKSMKMASTARGFSLIELMVALALGLVMIGAVVTVFVSNQQSARTKQELDRAQEAFRFASHTIMRVVQQGEIQPPGAFRALLTVNVSPADGHRDCLGRPIPPNTDLTTNTFFIDGTRLRCRVLTVSNNGANISTSEETIVDGIDAARTAFTFGVANVPTGYWSNNELWRQPNSIQVADWPNVRSVRVQLAMQSEGQAIGPTALFSATMRCGALDIC